MTIDDDALRIRRLVVRIGLLLQGQGPDVQGAVLGDLVAIFLAGHFVLDDMAATNELRETMLDMHVRLVRNLIEPNEAFILARLKAESH